MLFVPVNSPVIPSSAIDCGVHVFIQVEIDELWQRNASQHLQSDIDVVMDLSQRTGHFGEWVLGSHILRCWRTN